MEEDEAFEEEEEASDASEAPEEEIEEEGAGETQEKVTSMENYFTGQQKVRREGCTMHQWRELGGSWRSDTDGE